MRKWREMCWLLWFVVAACALGAAGCTAEAQRYIRLPNFAHPGPAAMQRADAVYHDPYPLNDVGPEVVGGRPLAYQQSLNEVDRARLVPPQSGVLRPIPVPGTAVTAPPVVSSPYAVPPPQLGTPLPTTAPPIVTSSAPTAPLAPPAIPYVAPTSPVVTNPYPATAPPTNMPSPQHRAPY